MKFFDLVFELVRQNVPIKEDDWANLKRECEEDTREWGSEDPNKFKSFYAKWNSKWQTRLFFTVMYIPLNRWINRLANPVAEEVETF